MPEPQGPAPAPRRCDSAHARVPGIRDASLRLHVNMGGAPFALKVEVRLPLPSPIPGSALRWPSLSWGWGTPEPRFLIMLA